MLRQSERPSMKDATKLRDPIFGVELYNLGSPQRNENDTVNCDIVFITSVANIDTDLLELKGQKRFVTR